MNPTVHKDRLDLALPYVEKRLDFHDQRLEKVLKDPTSTLQDKKDAAKIYTETAWLVEYLRSLGTCLVLALCQFITQLA